MPLGDVAPNQSVHPYVKKLNRTLARMGGLYLASDILRLVHEGRMQMFAEGDSIAVTQIALYPRAKVLEIMVVVGDLDELRILHDRLLTFAAEIGAGVIQTYGRRGWFPDAERRGWKVKAKNFVYQREL
jgi:hypothetical protein